MSKVIRAYPWCAAHADDEDGALLPAEILAASVSKFDDSQFDLATKSGDYLARIQLMTSNSDKCKDGSFPMNNYALVKDQNYVDLGSSVDVLCVAWRPKALEMGEAVITVFDPSQAEFQRIQEKSSEPNSGCMYGPEYLLYVPSAKAWATFFMGTKSARREAPALKALLHKGATLSSHKIETPKFTWFAPRITKCSTPFELPEDMEELKEQVDKFNNPPVTEIEHVDDSSDARAR